MNVLWPKAGCRSVSSHSFTAFVTALDTDCSRRRRSVRMEAEDAAWCSTDIP